MKFSSNSVNLMWMICQYGKCMEFMSLLSYYNASFRSRRKQNAFKQYLNCLIQLTQLLEVANQGQILKRKTTTWNRYIFLYTDDMKGTHMLLNSIVFVNYKITLAVQLQAVELSIELIVSHKTFFFFLFRLLGFGWVVKISII